MTPDSDRLAVRLREASDRLSTSPGLLGAVRAGGRRRLRRRRATAAAVMALVAAVVLGVPAPWSSVPDRLLQVAGWSDRGASRVESLPQAALPERMAGYSYLTGSVWASPPGPALALYQQGFGVEFMDFPQALVMSADGEDYRRVDLAERRAGAESQGDPAPMLLAPDGSRVAVGRHSSRAADVALLDLTTGGVERHAVPGARSVQPLAWSSDGRWLAYLANEEPTNPHSGRTTSGEPGLLDLTAGQARTLPGPGAAIAMAFAPDGAELAVQRAGGGVQVVGTDGVPVRDLGTAGRLAGPAAWSPDGQHLLVRNPKGGLDLLDATGGGTEVLDDVAIEADQEPAVLGWTAPRRLLLATTADDGPDGDFQVVEVDLNTQQRRVITTLPTSGNFAVSRFHFATALLPELQQGPGDDVDRGPWPVWLQIGLALAALLVLTSIVRLRRAHLQQERTSADPP